MLETAKLIDGKKIAEDIKSELKEDIEKFTKENFSRKPRLAVIIVGDDPASHYYVKNKEKACELVGIDSKKTVLAAETSKEELQNIHEIVDGDGRKKTVTISKRLLSSLLVDHHRMVAYLGPLVSNAED